jgi:hypothetical protein
MANTYYLPIRQAQTALAKFYERVSVLKETGLVDFIDEGEVGGMGGDYIHLPRFFRINQSGSTFAFTKADVTGTLTSGTADLDQSYVDEVAVVRHRTFLKTFFTSEATRSDSTTERLDMQLGEQIAMYALKDLNFALLMAGIASAYSSTVPHLLDIYNGSSPAYLDPFQVEVARGLLGDQMTNLKTMITTGASYSKYGQEVMGGSGGTKYAVFNVMGSWYENGVPENSQGFKVMLDDDMPKSTGSTGYTAKKKNYTLLCRPKWADPNGQAPFVVCFKKPLTEYAQHVLGGQAIQFQRQPELVYAVGVRGKTWDINNGHANPDDTAFFLSTNWDDAYYNHRELGLAVIRHN